MVIGSGVVVVPKLLNKPITTDDSNKTVKTDNTSTTKNTNTTTIAAAPVAHLIIHTEPPTALVTIDDAPVANPFTGEFPKSDVRHRLQAKATGYQNQAQWIAFDGDHELTLTLLRVPPPHEAEAHPHGHDAKAVAGDPKGDAKTDNGKPVYKGTKGKLITEFPE